MIVCAACTGTALEDHVVDVLFDLTTGAELDPLEVLERNAALCMPERCPGCTYRDYAECSHPKAPDPSVLMVQARARALPGVGARQEVRTLEVATPTMFDGDIEAAAAAGWTEDEYGHLCPSCGAAAAEQPGVTHGTVSNPFEALLLEKK